MTGNSECDLFPREPVSGTTVLNFQIQDNCFTHYTVVGSLSFLHCPLCATVQLCSFSDPKCHPYHKPLLNDVIQWDRVCKAQYTVVVLSSEYT